MPDSWWSQEKVLQNGLCSLVETWKVSLYIYIYSKVNGCWFYRYFFSNTNLYLRRILLAIHKLYYNTLFTRTHFLTTHSISYTTSMSCVHWNPIIITLFTMFTLIEYCISDISNINFIILNMLKKNFSSITKSWWITLQIR